MSDNQQNVTQPFLDDWRGIYSFIDEILVECPMCGAAAANKRDESDSPDWFTPRTLQCSRCGFLQKWAGNALQRATKTDPMVDYYFHTPLWLQTACAGRVLWAYNAVHLSFLERSLAEAGSKPEKMGRLPKWMLAEENAQELRRGIDALRAKLG